MKRVAKRNLSTHFHTLRARWALWCAALVTGAGVAVVLLTVSLTSSHLREETRALHERTAPPLSRPSGAPRPAEREREQQQQQGQIADNVIADARRTGLCTVGGLALLSLGLGWVVAGRMVRPISEITRVAQEVSGGRIGGRIGERTGTDDAKRDELTLLARAFDDMLDRLDRAFDAQRSFVADASHELRTPLTLMRAEIDVALDDPQADATSMRAALTATSFALDRATRLVASLLALSRSETLINVSEVDLAESVRHSLRIHPTADHVVRESLRVAVVRGDAVLIDRLVDNLVDNAVRYAPAGGTIEVTTDIAGGCALLTIANPGPKFIQREVDDLFRRFVRHAPASEAGDQRGTGIGLAIVAATVRTHGGTITAHPLSNGGLTIIVSLPASVPAEAAAIAAIDGGDQNHSSDHR